VDRGAGRLGPVSLAVLVGLVLLLGAAAPALTQSALEVMQKHRTLQRARDEQETQVLKLVDKNGATKQRRIVRYTRTGSDELAKILIRFLAPRDVENTGLLTWEGKGGDDDQWLYLPATRKVKRIAASGKKNRFMGTDFAFEDLRPENLALYRYTMVGTETVAGQPCHVVEAVPATERQAADSGYSKRKLWVRQDNFSIVKREYYDKKQKLEKVQTEQKLVRVSGTIWRADEIEMHDVTAGTRTLIVVEDRRVDTGLPDSFFTEAQLTRDGSGS
jgi:outer membrane lipoprotein-sorting protein